MLSRLTRGNAVLLVAAAALIAPSAARAQSQCSAAGLEAISAGLIRSVDKLSSGSRRDRAALVRAMLSEPVIGPLFGESEVNHFSSSGVRLVHWINQYVRYGRMEGSQANTISARGYVARAYSALPNSVKENFRCYLQAQSSATSSYNGGALSQALSHLAASHVVVAGAPSEVSYSGEHSALRAVSRASPVPPRVENATAVARDRSIFQSLGIPGLVLEASGPTATSDASVEAGPDAGVGYHRRGH